jgi:hypothetical protein
MNALSIGRRGFWFVFAPGFLSTMIVAYICVRAFFWALDALLPAISAENE